MEFVYISPGSFIMGSPEYEEGRDSDENLHEVMVTKGFYMQITEVTQGQWKELMGTNPWQGDKYIREGKNYPVSCVSWYDTQKFIQRLNQREGKDIYRLPTEAEWEYGCRAGSQSIFCYGDNEETLSAYAWYSKNAYDIGEKYAHRVAQKQSNAWGLYDMYGNVWEWCQDLYGNYPSFPVTDPIGPMSGTKRVNRGGSWVYYARRCRSAARGLNDPSVKHDNLGFRLIMKSEPKKN
ncbi:MAG: formylglycine-generating enzyme family protein [bacterium]